MRKLWVYRVKDFMFVKQGGLRAKKRCAYATELSNSSMCLLEAATLQVTGATHVPLFQMYHQDTINSVAPRPTQPQDPSIFVSIHRHYLQLRSLLHVFDNSNTANCVRHSNHSGLGRFLRWPGLRPSLMGMIKGAVLLQRVSSVPTMK
jgi:hypothetical protein